MGATRQAWGAADDEKFACMVLRLPRHSDFDQPLRLGDDSWVLPNLPVDLGRWREWIGTLGVDHIESSNCFLWTKARSDAPQVYDGDAQALADAVSRLFYGLLLQGVFPYPPASVLTGHGERGTPRIMSRSDVVPHFSSPGAPLRRANRNECTTARIAADGLKAIDSSDAFERLRRGFEALTNAMRAKRPEDRLHQYVRAMDGLFKLKSHQGYNDFGLRCATFMGPGDLAATFAGCYLIRNNVEHVNFWGDDLKWENEHIVKAKGARLDGDALLTDHLRVIETLALGVYLCLATSTERASLFESDHTIDNFWEKDEESRRAIWGVCLLAHR